MAKPGKRPRTALVLSGGGVRGAYQVGVLRGLVEQGFLSRGQSDVDVQRGADSSGNALMICWPVGDVEMHDASSLVREDDELVE